MFSSADSFHTESAVELFILSLKQSIYMLPQATYIAGAIPREMCLLLKVIPRQKMLGVNMF